MDRPANVPPHAKESAGRWVWRHDAKCEKCGWLRKKVEFTRWKHREEIGFEPLCAACQADASAAVHYATARRLQAKAQKMRSDREEKLRLRAQASSEVQP